jgi:2-methylisocitrate lyase-like PEP mutase family enzyme
MTALRDLLQGKEAVAAPGVHDPLTAKIAARAGHRALYLGGNAMALGLGKGQPFLTLTETVEIMTRVARTTELPTLVDAGAGFGEPTHLDLAIRELEAAGAGGAHIDDQPYPKRAAYHRGQGGLAEPALMAARLAAAAAARRSPAFPIVARTDALRVTRSLDEAVARCRAYVAAGAEALMVLDLGPDQAGVVRDACPGIPLVWIGGVTPPIPALAALDAAGFRLACYPFNGIAAISTLLADLWMGLAETGAIGQSDETLARARADALALADMQRAWDIEDRDGEA